MVTELKKKRNSFVLTAMSGGRMARCSWYHEEVLLNANKCLALTSSEMMLEMWQV
jgi:hypothetical protein